LLPPTTLVGPFALTPGPMLLVAQTNTSTGTLRVTQDLNI